MIPYVANYTILINKHKLELMSFFAAASIFKFYSPINWYSEKKPTKDCFSFNDNKTFQITFEIIIFTPYQKIIFISWNRKFIDLSTTCVIIQHEWGDNTGVKYLKLMNYSEKVLSAIIAGVKLRSKMLFFLNIVWINSKFRIVLIKINSSFYQ